MYERLYCIYDNRAKSTNVKDLGFIKITLGMIIVYRKICIRIDVNLEDSFAASLFKMIMSIS